MGPDAVDFGKLDDGACRTAREEEALARRLRRPTCGPPVTWFLWPPGVLLSRCAAAMTQTGLDSGHSSRSLGAAWAGTLSVLSFQACHPLKGLEQPFGTGLMLPSDIFSIPLITRAWLGGTIHLTMA